MSRLTSPVDENSEVSPLPKDESGTEDDSPSANRPARELPGRLAGKTLPRQVLSLAIWPFFELLLNSAVGIVDMSLAGRLATGAVAASDAVGVAGYIDWFINMMSMSVGVGAGALVARAVGSRHRALANAGLGQSLLIAVAWGLVIGGLIYLLAPGIAQIFLLQDRAFDLAVVYLRLLSVATPFAAVLFVANAVLRAAGEMRTPFLVMLVINVVNIGISCLVVFGPEPIGGHGVAGIAIGTLSAWVLGSVLVLGALVSGRMPIRLRLIRLRPRWHTAWRIIRVAVPAVTEAGGMWIGNVFVGRIVGLLAATAGVAGLMGSHIIAVKIESISFLPAVAIGIAAATLTGQYLGLGDPHRARRAAQLCWMLGAGLMGATGVLFLLLPEPLARIITDEPRLYEQAASVIRIAGPVQVFFGSYLVLSKALRGAGDTTGPMVITYLSTFLIRLPAAYVIGIVLGYGLSGVWIGLCGELVIRGCVFIFRFQRGKWQTMQI